MDRGKIQA